MENTVLRAAAMGVLLLLVATAQQAIGAEREPETEPEVFAYVNGEPIEQRSYETALRAGARQKFFHGRPPEAELIEFRKQVAERLIEERILHQAAVRNGVQPDQDWVEAEFAKIEKSYASSPQWQESGEELKQQIRESLAERSLIKQYDDSLREIPDPTDEAVLAYYQANPDKFTSPEQIKVSSILLKVEPWQPKEVWTETRLAAEDIYKALQAGASFDDFAEEYPPVADAQLGYIHRGMLGDKAQAAIDELEVGQYSDVVQLLEGVAIFRLDALKPAQLNPLDKVRERAAALLRRDQVENTYKERIRVLRSSAEVKITDPQYYDVARAGTPKDKTHLKPAHKKE